MKPDKIEWVTVRSYLDFPSVDQNRVLLLSYINTGYGDNTPKITEGFYKKYEGHKDIHIDFIDVTGKLVFGVYAWAYKPECMMGKQKE